MDRIQVAAAGVSLGASGLLLALGVGLVCDVRSRDERAQALMARGYQAHMARLAESERDLGERQRAELAELRQQVREREASIARTRAMAREREARDQEAELDRLVRAWDQQASRRTYPVAATEVQASAPTDESGVADMLNLGTIREAVRTGDLAKIREAVAQHNAQGGEPVFLHDDPELTKRGISVRARWNRRTSEFGVTLQAEAGDEGEACTVLVAPGAIVKSGGDGYQDTAPIQARFIRVGPKQRKAEADATICCAQIHSEDPRALPSKGLATHENPRVALVAAAAETTHASWGAAQVAIWAVANDATRQEVASAPGSYSHYIEPAREVLEKAGIDTNKLPLYASATPRARRGALDMDLLQRFNRRG